MIKIEKLTPDLEEKYENFIRGYDKSMIYYSIKFRDFLKEVTGGTPEYYIAIKSDDIQGVLPLFFKDGLLGKVINSLPFYGSNGGILSDDNEIKIKFLNFYKKLIQDKNILSATIISNPLDPDYDYGILNADEEDYRIGQFTFIGENYSDCEDLMLKFHSKTRNSVRKALKSGVKVEVNNEAFDFLLAIHEENMREIGGIAKNHTFFECVKKYFREGIDYNLYVAKYKDEMISALLVFYFNGVVEYYTPVIKSKFKDLQPLSLLITQAMFNASIKGYKWWNWGGTWATQEGVYNFKSRWGTVEKIYHYYINIKNPEVYSVNKNFLLEHYSWFYVIPFRALEDEKH